ncbi:MAG: glycosyltransferase family 2 protein [Actinomycetota bacterium]
MLGEPVTALRTPVVLSIFERPDTTRAVFAEIAAARPERLFVIVDGPRDADDVPRIEASLEVVGEVDWPCEVRIDRSEVNLGCRVRLRTGIDRVFAEVDEAIILEDDTLPDPSFFRFCTEMLERYRDDERVMMITGTNYLDRWHDDVQSYHLARVGGLWGCATWARAWARYDAEMAGWRDPAVRAAVRAYLADDEVYEFEAARFDAMLARDDSHSWDLAWLCTRLMEQGTTVVSAVNLMENLGNADGRGIPADHPIARLRRRSLEFPLRPPATDAPDREYDRLHVRRMADLYRPAAPVVRPRWRRAAGRLRRAWRTRGGRRPISPS